MILFFGTRPGKSRSRKLAGIRCPNCSQANTLEGTVTPNFFHLFWIPILKLKTFYFIRCAYCKAAYYQDEFTPEMANSLEE